MMTQKPLILLKLGILLLLMTVALQLFSQGQSEVKEDQASEKKIKNYTVAAYVWPSCQNDPIAREFFWGQGIGEWEMIQKGTPRFPGHYQPKLPLWGYEMDDRPGVMEKKIKAATDHGVNAFIFDWYWYNGKPFLEGTVNAFMKAENNSKMKFYLMWANHDVPGSMWNHYRYKTDSVLWKGTVDWANFKLVVDRMIKSYFLQSNYYRIKDQPVISIYHIRNLIQSFGGVEGAKKALEYFRKEVVKAGFPGLHIQVVGGDKEGEPQFWGVKENPQQLIDQLAINSVTMYNMAGSTDRKEDYLHYGNTAVKVRESWDKQIDIPFFPCVSVGWDDTPRYPKKGQESVVHLNNNPSSFGSFLQKAKEYTDEHPDQPSLIIVNAWNEWVEGSYLEPDMKWGYGYLKAVKKVIGGKYETQMK